MASARRLSFPAAEGMVDGIHRDAPHFRAVSEPAIAPRLTYADLLELGVSDLADGSPAIHPHHPHLT